MAAVVVLAALLAGCGAGPGSGSGTTSDDVVRGPSGLVAVPLADLPPEAAQTIALVESGGPYPYAQDGLTFFNREGLLPGRPVGYYREFTVVTPGSPDRGARRIVAGDGGELFYTDDHYASFREVTP